jgi:hypothetical protein
MTKNRSTTWSAARQRQALDLSARYLHGASINELARTTGLSKSTVLNRLRLVDTPMRTPQQTRRLRADPAQAAARSERAAEMRDWYETGASVAALAAVFDCSPARCGGCSPRPTPRCAHRARRAPCAPTDRPTET